MRLNIYKSKCAARELIYKTYAALRTDPQPDTIFMQISKLLFSVFFHNIFSNINQSARWMLFMNRACPTLDIWRVQRFIVVKIILELILKCK